MTLLEATETFTSQQVAGAKNMAPGKWNKKEVTGRCRRDQNRKVPEKFTAVVTKCKARQKTKDERSSSYCRSAFFLTSARMSVLAMRFLPTLGQNLNRSSNVICENPNGHCVTATTVCDANCAVFSHICQPHAVWLRLGSLLFARCAKPFRISVRSNVICLACLSTLNQQCRQPQQIRKLAQRLYTLACWIASQISAKASLFHGQTLPSSTTGTQR